MNAVLEDLVHSMRSVRRNPGFTAAAVSLIALGLGATASILTVARTLVFRPLPFEDPDRLVSIWREPARGGNSFGASWPHLADWKLQKHIFHSVEAYIHTGEYAFSTTAGGDSGMVSELQVTEDFFPLLGIRPLAGKLFPSGAAPDHLIVGYEFWRRRFGSSPAILGRAVRVGDSTRVIVGVLPPGFRIFRNDLPEVFSPLRPYPDHVADRSMTYLAAIARLQPGVSIERARADLAAYSRRAEKAYPRTDAGWGWKVQGLRDRWFGARRPLIAVLLAAAACVLLIACANLATLLLVRAGRRQREFAIRRALGGGALRLVRQVFAESLVFALAGGATGLLLALWATDLFTALSVEAEMGLPPMRMDATVVGLTFLIALATAVLFGAAPAAHVWRVDINASLKAGGSASAGRSSSHRLGGALVITEIALSTLLLVAAGLLVRTSIRLKNVDPGFHADNVLAMSIGRAPYAAQFRQRDSAFWSELHQRASAVPGVTSAAYCGAIPLAAEQAPENMKVQVTVEGRPLPAPGFLEAEYQDVSPGYFRTLGIPLKRGRLFQPTAAGRLAVILNESFAREHWGAGDPVGERIRAAEGPPYVIVGVAGDVKQYNLRAAPAKRQIYRALWPDDMATLSKWPSQYLVVRTSEPADRIAPLLRKIVASIDPERPVILARTMRDVARRSTTWDQWKTSVVGLFGGAALLLTFIGMYGVLSRSVSSRRREIGLRVALGGQPGAIRCMILRQGITWVAAGLAIGISAGLGLMPLVSDQLFGVGTADLPTFASVTFLVAAVGLVACYRPMRNTTAVDPMSVLREE